MKPRIVLIRPHKASQILENALIQDNIRMIVGWEIVAAVPMPNDLLVCNPCWKPEFITRLKHVCVGRDER